MKCVREGKSIPKRWKNRTNGIYYASEKSNEEKSKFWGGFIKLKVPMELP